MTQTNDNEVVSTKIFTVPNVISLCRLCLIPVYLILLLKGYNALATFIFAFAAATDFVDGYIARKTHCVSKLGQLLDPAVDRLLMITGVVGLLLVERLPLWMVIFVVVRDLYVLAGGYILLNFFKRRVPVVFLGKVATTFLYVGFAGLLLNQPQISALNFTTSTALPLFNGVACSWGYCFIYIGLFLAVVTTVHYTVCGVKEARDAHKQKCMGE